MVERANDLIERASALIEEEKRSGLPPDDPQRMREAVVFRNPITETLQAQGSDGNMLALAWTLEARKDAGGPDLGERHLSPDEFRAAWGMLMMQYRDSCCRNPDPNTQGLKRWIFRESPIQKLNFPDLGEEILHDEPAGEELKGHDL